MLPYISVPFAWAADKIGASSDELKIIFTFLVSYPLAGLLKRIPDSKPWAKNAFIISVALFYIVGLLDLWWGLTTIFLQAAGTYAIAAYIKGPYMPWIGFVFNMGYMSVSHIYRMSAADTGAVDISGPQMVMVMKITAFCWNVYDGTQPEELLDSYQKDRALKEMPSLLNYAGFVLFFPSFFPGPAFDYKEYQRWIETSMFDLPPGTDPAKAPPTRKKRRIPRSGTPAMIKMATGLGWLIAFLQVSARYAPDLLLGEQSAKYGFLHRIWLLHMLGVTTRLKYYAIWTLTEGACILAGIGYKGIDPKTGKADWSRLQNVNPLGVELAQNSHAYLGNWNMNTNHWLRNYIYLRVTPRGQKPGFRASLATFVTSAFWHGFYPGYYMTFVLASFMQNIAKNSRRLLRPFFMTPDGKHPLPTKRYYDFFSFLVTQLAFSFCTAPFVLLSVHDSTLAWGRVYFYGIIGVLAGSGFLLTPGKQWLQHKVKSRSRPALERVDSTDERPVLGLPSDPGMSFDQMVEEIAAELEARKKKGLPVSDDLKKVVRDKLGKDI